MSDKNSQDSNSQQDQVAPDQGPSMEEVSKLKERNQKLQGQLSDIEKKYSTFASIYKDIDPDEYKNLKAKLEEVEKKSASNDPAKLEELFERKMQKFRAEVESEKTTLVQQLEALKKTNRQLAVTDKVMGEISGMFNTDAIKFVKREVEELCDLDEDGSIVVKDENGDIMYKGARPITLKEFAEHLMDKYPSLAKASGVSGTKDMTPGQVSRTRNANKVPQSWAELQAMPNAREVLERLKREDPAAVQKILRTINA